MNKQMNPLCVTMSFKIVFVIFSFVWTTTTAFPVISNSFTSFKSVISTVKPSTQLNAMYQPGPMSITPPNGNWYSTYNPTARTVKYDDDPRFEDPFGFLTITNNWPAVHQATTTAATTEDGFKGWQGRSNVSKRLRQQIRKIKLWKALSFRRRIL